MGIYLYCWYCGWLRNPAPGRVDGKRPAIIPSFPLFRSISMHFRVTNIVTVPTGAGILNHPRKKTPQNSYMARSPLLVPQYYLTTLFSSCRSPFLRWADNLPSSRPKPKLTLDFCRFDSATNRGSKSLNSSPWPGKPTDRCVWKWLVPLKPMVLLIIIPMKNG